MVSEQELTQCCGKGDRKAQETLYKTYADRLFRLCFRYVRSEVDAEDVLSIAFGKIFGAIGMFSYQGEGSTEAWMRKIIVNESLMWLRRRHNFNLMETLDESLSLPDLSQLSHGSAEDIYSAIAGLPAGYRTVFNLSVIEGFNHSEISTMLEISENTSRSQLFKARAMLQKILNREGFNYGT